MGRLSGKNTKGQTLQNLAKCKGIDNIGLSLHALGAKVLQSNIVSVSGMLLTYEQTVDVFFQVEEVGLQTLGKFQGKLKTLGIEEQQMITLAPSPRFCAIIPVIAHYSQTLIDNRLVSNNLVSMCLLAESEKQLRGICEHAVVLRGLGFSAEQMIRLFREGGLSSLELAHAVYQKLKCFSEGPEHMITLLLAYHDKKELEDHLGVIILKKIGFFAAYGCCALGIGIHKWLSAPLSDSIGHDPMLNKSL